MKIISRFFTDASWFFEPNGTFTIDIPDLNSKVTYSSHRTLLQGFEKPIVNGVDILTEVEADDLEAGIVKAEGLLGNFGAVIAFATNADSFDLSHVFTTTDAYEGDQRPFIATRVNYPEASPLARRQVPTLATLDVLQKSMVYPKLSRLSRAIAQYVHAISYWKPGSETLVLSHAWMALEVLTPLAKEQSCSDISVKSAEEYADHHGIDLKRVDGHVREHSILHGDSALYQAAKKASDGFEHGFKDFQEINRVARLHSYALLTNVRKTILSLLGVEKLHVTELMETPYNVPYCFKHVKFMKGNLHGDGTHKDVLSIKTEWTVQFEEKPSDKPDANVSSSDTFKLEPSKIFGISKVEAGIRDFNPAKPK